MRNLSKLFFIFPIKKNRVMFYSFSGKEYSGSPKYISEYIKNNYENEYEIIWAVNEPKKFPFLKTVKYKTLKHVFYSATSKVIVTNTGPYKAVAYRKSQIVINTWHGGGAYKKTGIDNPYKNKYEILYNKNLGQAGVNLFISSSKLFTQYVIRGAFGYQGKVLECGLPRNDIFFDDLKKAEILEKVKRILNISSCTKIVMYAPTWRNYSMDEYESLDVERLLKVLEEEFAGEWIFLIRGHNLSNSYKFLSSNRIVNVTNYPDMQELLIATDVLISDYSSCIWDYSLLMRKVFLFVPDLAMYSKKFSFYTPIRKWGFHVAESNIELENLIKSFDEIENKKNIEENHLFFGSLETGKATEAVVDYIIENTKPKGRVNGRDC